MVIKVYHMSRPKANEPRHIWTPYVAQSDHHSWCFLVLLDLFDRYFSNYICDVIIRISVYLQDFFLSFFSCFSLSIINYINLFLILKRIIYIICDILNYVIFLDIWCNMLFYLF